MRIVFWRNQTITFLILTICWIIKGVCAKNLEATLLSIDFSNVFDSIHREKMEQIFLADGLHKETVTTIMMLYKNTKAMVHSPEGDTNFFDIVSGVLQGDTLAPYLVIICLDYVLWISVDLMNENSLTLKKDKEQTISCRNYYGRSLHKWSGASYKYTCISQIVCCTTWKKQ